MSTEERDYAGRVHDENARPLREVGRRRRANVGPTLGATDSASALGQGRPIVHYASAPIRTRRDDLLDASRARRGGRGGACGDGGGCLDRSGLGEHPGRKPAPALSRPERFLAPED